MKKSFRTKKRKIKTTFILQSLRNNRVPIQHLEDSAVTIQLTLLQEIPIIVLYSIFDKNINKSSINDYIPILYNWPNKLFMNQINLVFSFNYLLNKRRCFILWSKWAVSSERLRKLENLIYARNLNKTDISCTYLNILTKYWFFNVVCKW